MKKLLALATALVLTLSLAACGGSSVDKAAAQKAMANAGTALTEAGEYLQANLETVDTDEIEPLVSSLGDITDALTDLRPDLDSDDVSQDRLDEIAQKAAEYEGQIKDIKSQAEQLVAAAESAPDEGQPEASGERTSNPDSVLNKLNVVYVPENIVGTGWEFSGGYLNGQNMEMDDANALLEAYGGVLQVVFNSDTEINMVQGGGTLSGIYEVRDNGAAMFIMFDPNGANELAYKGCFASVDDQAVLVLLNAEETDAMFFTQIDEG